MYLNKIMVIHVFANQPAKMLFVQGDDMVQYLSATTAHPPFRQTILPWRSNTCSLGLQTGCLQKPDHVNVELRIAVQDDIPIWASLRKGLARLLNYPIRCRVSYHVKVEHFAAAVLDDEEQ
jgi:hypothetical protein